MTRFLLICILSVRAGTGSGCAVRIERWWRGLRGRRCNRVMLRIRLKRRAAASRAALLLSAIALVVFGEGLWR